MPRRLPKKIESVAFVSLGCPKNLVDSERMLGLLAADGLAVTSDASEADAIIINTCGFLEASKTESLQAIREAIEQKKTGRCQRVIVAGCLVQRYKTKLLADVPEVDRLVGVFDREHIVEAVRGQSNPRQEHGHFLGKYHDLGEEGTKARRHEGTKGRRAERGGISPLLSTVLLLSCLAQRVPRRARGYVIRLIRCPPPTALLSEDAGVR
jgi:tRNA A37 methylthiotransferase MiaB